MAKLPEQHDRRRKLTSQDYTDIRQKYRPGENTHKELAIEYGVSHGTIARIINPEIESKDRGKNWYKYYDKDKHRQRIKEYRQHRKEVLHGSKP